MLISPKPQYIDVQDIRSQLGEKKVLINDDDTYKNNGIPYNVAQMRIAEGESYVVKELSPYYITDPTILVYNPITHKKEELQALSTICPADYAVLYAAFVDLAMAVILGTFVGRNTGSERSGLDFYLHFADNGFINFKNRIDNKLANGAFKYPFKYFIPDPNGILRKPKNYAKSGNMGGDTYTSRQLTDPQINWQYGVYNNFNY